MGKLRANTSGFAQKLAIAGGLPYEEAMPDHPTEAVEREKAAEIAAALRNEYAPTPQPTGPTADAYRIAGYTDEIDGGCHNRKGVLGSTA